MHTHNSRKHSNSDVVEQSVQGYCSITRHHTETIQLIEIVERHANERGRSWYQLLTGGVKQLIDLVAKKKPCGKDE
ncbi:hypothetical protein PsorP6_014835 [Peronosclerospora sorghi]|uniref:Uncharacterized protein n=1 Tax=Peronosclerospora sorghi TaxID=230839 RepID=A0ACC0VRK0_9STRA|nr:hypothetical protein PsorP6_014835 [Peronosclerospora sorghi]